jgi:hypothetical protein
MDRRMNRQGHGGAARPAFDNDDHDGQGQPVEAALLHARTRAKRRGSLTRPLRA